ncbi:PREDICTED: uncharacterized protein C8orf58 homolog [Chrysochloris asiatica]|uniref:Uncharacterized protein C8orf58 homolog n=1 Tax=Chrysochloris asiatica TaxID=185453 RepID=A0A9B0WNU9_CHRAS|nr:PREDICTED: uncharacterized protein C8orf58 homolog [Chrysochloris asiatica]
MLGRRRVFAVEPRDRVGEDLACGCVVPGVSSTYRRIQDTADCCFSLDSWIGDGQLRESERPVPLLKLSSRDSGVEMAVGGSSPTPSPGLSQDSLDFVPMEGSEFSALGVMEPPAQLGRLLASRKLEQVLERSRWLPTSPASSSGQHCVSKPECEVPPSEQETTTEGEAGLDEAEAVESLEPEVWTCLPGHGLRYLEHLCLVLEQMARLQQLYLQLQTQRPARDLEEEEEPVLAPSPSPSYAPSCVVQVPWDMLSQTKETGKKAASCPKVGVSSTIPPTLPETPAEPTHTFPSSQRHKLDLSHWDKVKVLLNRIRWRSSRHPEPPALPDGPAPRMESRDFPERPQRRPHHRTFIPSFVVKKQRTKNLSVC